MPTLTDKDIEVLTERIVNGDCVLFIGPNLFVGPENASLYSSFSSQKCKQMQDNGIAFDLQQAANMYYTVGRYIKGMSLRDQGQRIESTTNVTEKRAFISHINSNIVDDEIYRKLSELPFFLTINTNPDDRLHRLKKIVEPQKNIFFSFYDFNKENNEKTAENDLPDEINPDNYVIYNVYGHATNERMRSVVTTEAEFVNYARKVNLPGNGMPAAIKNFIKNEKVCLFLGFEYQSWPLKILLQALGFSSEIPKQSISFYNGDLPQHLSDFYIDDMRFLFVDDKIDQFVGRLHGEFVKGGGKGPSISVQPDEPVKAVFVSKSFPQNEGQRKDIVIRDLIAAKLKPLQMKGYLRLWSEDKAMASENASIVATEMYESADIFILLGSDSITDDEVWSNVGRALSLVKKDPLKKIIPVYVRHFLYDSIQEVVPRENWIPRAEDGTPVPILSQDNNEERRSTEVCEIIRSIVNQKLA